MESMNNLLVRRNIGNLKTDDNLCFKEEILTGIKYINPADYNWYRASNATTQDIVLPDSTDLVCGWSITIDCKSDSVDTVNVKSYHATVPVLIREVGIGESFEFTLVSKSTTAGTWKVTSLSDGTSGDIVVTGDNEYSGDNEFSGDNDFTGESDFTTGSVKLPILTPVNATPTTVVATVVARPAGYVANVYSTKELTVASVPLTQIDNVYATGSITCSAPYPSVDDTFEFAGETFTFKAARGGANEVTIAATPTDQGAAIAFAINTDTAHTATNNAGVVSLVSSTAGTAGNALTLVSALAGVVVSPVGGTLEGGVDAVAADTVTFDDTGSPFTFVLGTAGAGEIEVGIDEAATVLNILATTPDTANYTLVAGSTAAKFKIKATALGTAGDGITSSETGASITGTGDTAGGVDEVRNYITVAGKNYTFATTASDNPTVAYPADIPVFTGLGASVGDVADAWVLKLEEDTSVFTVADVTAAGGVITMTYKTKGVIGNPILTYANHLGTAGNITMPGVVAGVDGTIGTANQVAANASYVYVCIAANGTSGNYWRRISLGSVY
jgi:hypothetical protein